MGKLENNEKVEKSNLIELLHIIETLSTSEISNIQSIPEEKAKINMLKIRKGIKWMDKFFLEFIEKSSPKLEYKQEDSKKKFIKIGCNNIEKMLHGGFELGKLYLFFGEYATGKSQISHQLCISTLKYFWKKKENIKVLYIDTEGTFRPERLQDMVKTTEYNFHDFLKNINVMKVSSSIELLNKIRAVDLKIQEWGIKLIVIDSLTNHIRQEMGEKKGKTQPKRNIIEILRILNQIAQKNRVLICITSQIRTVGKSSSSFSIKPIMEEILNSYMNEMILLSRSLEGDRFAYLINSTQYPEMNVEFQITADGVGDPTS